MSTEYVPYKPVYKHGDQLIVSTDSLSTEFRENIKIVFKFYDVSYKEDENGVILIPKKIWEDKDTIWNYTTKANDPDWLKNHR